MSVDDLSAAFESHHLSKRGIRKVVVWPVAAAAGGGGV